VASGFHYHLPEENIALYPAAERSNSKLLVCKGGAIENTVFYNIDRYLPSESLLIRNISKVLKARLYLFRETGARIEVFCLGFEQNESGKAVAECLIKNVRKLKTGELLTCEKQLNGIQYKIQAGYEGRKGENSHVVFTWNNPDADFYRILDIFGNAPLPPYIKRQAQEIDSIRYQTIYAGENGSVAAPTAGLHFSEEVEAKLKLKHITTANVTLHVGLGTFLPMKSPILQEHRMHSETFAAGKETLIQLLKNKNDNVVCVGTTSLRTLESLYIAAHFLTPDSSPFNLKIGQWDHHHIQNFFSRQEAWKRLLEFAEKKGVASLSGQTSLMITPDYHCHTIDFLITNFHQPNSTLLLIVASLIGERWREAYDYALQNNFRFLSYGDACLFKNKVK
jgi:S-adenosylmethionine:tRNA ribosyltransferase-isomerase